MVYPHYEGKIAVLPKGISLAPVLLFLIYVPDIPRKYLNILFYSASYGGSGLALTLSLVFLLIPAGKKASRDTVLGMTSYLPLVPCRYGCRLSRAFE